MLLSCQESDRQLNMRTSLQYLEPLCDDHYLMDGKLIGRLTAKMSRNEKGKTIADIATRQYYQDANHLLWTNIHGTSVQADSLIKNIEELCQYGISPTYFRLEQIKTDLQRIRQLDLHDENLNHLSARLDYNLTRAYLRYAMAQQFGFCDPSQLLNHIDVRDSDSVRITYNQVFDIPIRHTSREAALVALRKVVHDSVAPFLSELQPPSPLYKQLANAYTTATTDSRRNTLLVNMERCRWRLRSYPHQQERYVVVNLPSYHLRMVGPDSVSQMRIGCGTVKTKTPLLTSMIERMDVNPIWVIPGSIVEKEVARHCGDSSWFSRHRYFVRNRKSGHTLPGYQASWSMLHDKAYMVFQQGGKGNSLGRIIFRFNNSFAVFIHDTSSPAFFARDSRSVSHGCVRVERPYDLALFLLGDKAAQYADDLLYNMKADSIDDKSRHIGSLNVEPKVPIYITYYTAYPAIDGTLEFLPDIYGYDKHILEYLAGKCLKTS